MKITSTADLGKVIRSKRKKLGYTQAQLSEYTGFSTSFISDLENGKETAEFGRALFLLQLLGLDLMINDRGGRCVRKLQVYIEIEGMQTYVGSISGSSPNDAQFAYSDQYIAAGHPPISISLPISGEPFSAETTKNFFEGLLPEGFARKCVANWIHTSEDDYLTILSVLGSECLGALHVSDNIHDSGDYKSLSIESVKALAKEGVSKSTELITEAHLSLTGASGKVGLYYDPERNMWYQPQGDAPSTHIVKQSHVRLSDIVTNEQLSLTAASKLGISIPESFIINTGAARDDEILFATKRYDRVIPKNAAYINGLIRPFRLHQEDFAQALGIPAYEKYENGNKQYLLKAFQLLRNNVADPLTDQLKWWDMLIYDYLNCIIGCIRWRMKRKRYMFLCRIRTLL